MSAARNSPVAIACAIFSTSGPLGRSSSSAATRRAYDFVRAAVASLDDDRPMGREYEALARRILDGELPWRLNPAGPAA